MAKNRRNNKKAHGRMAAVRHVGLTATIIEEVLETENGEFLAG